MIKRFFLSLLCVTTLLIVLLACEPVNPGLADPESFNNALSPTAELSGADEASSYSSANTLSGVFPGTTKSRPQTALGDPNAPVVIVEYSDYQCPFCRRYYEQTLPLIKEAFIDTGRVYYVFKDFPIGTLHPLAYRLHEAALCAGKRVDQSAFWESHDLFFEQAEAFEQSTLPAMDAAILAAFDQLEWPLNEIQSCLEANEFASEVNQYISEGRALGVNATPTFFINNNLLVGAQPYSVFKSFIEEIERGNSAPQLGQEPEQNDTQLVSLENVILRQETSLGDPDAPVTIVEYSDFQCPFCRRHFLSTMPLLKENYIDTGIVRYVFKDFPIASLHPFAYRLHEAALCASEDDNKDDYWRMHELFFSEADLFQVETLDRLDETIITQANLLGISNIKTCLQDGVYAQEVQNSVSEGNQLGVTGTPFFFIDGFPINGAQPYQQFVQVIELAQAGRLSELALGTNSQSNQSAQAGQLKIEEFQLEGAPAKGNVDAPITIIEFLDYQCPFCLRHFTNSVPQIQDYIDAGQVRYIFKDFPIHSIHPQAQKAHEAARCAYAQQGNEGYWKMHDLLFESQEGWGSLAPPTHESIFKGLARELGLSQSEFDECLDSGQFAAAVNVDLEEGMQFGVNATPTFFINGQILVGAQPFSVFQTIFEQILEDLE